MAKKTPKFEINRNEITIEFERQQPLCKELCAQALVILTKKLGQTSIKIHSIPTRVKSLKSFFEKIERYQIKKPFEEIDDVAGLRVICLFLSDLEKIGDLIRKNFEIIREDDKIDNSRFASFGYLSVHFIVKLGDAYKKPIYGDISDMPFEIQVRTIAMDAWANISHYLDYKTDQDIPKELKRDFYALNGMFYVADKHFQLFFEQREEKQEEISNVFEKGTQEDIFSQPLNLDTLAGFLKDKFPDRVLARTADASELVKQLTLTGYKTIKEINELVDNGIEALLLWESENPPTPSGKYTATGVVRTIARLTNDDFLKEWMGYPTGDNYDQEFEKQKARQLRFKKLIKNRNN